MGVGPSGGPDEIVAIGAITPIPRLDHPLLIACCGDTVARSVRCVLTLIVLLAVSCRMHYCPNCRITDPYRQFCATCGAAMFPVVQSPPALPQQVVQPTQINIIQERPRRKGSTPSGVCIGCGGLIALLGGMAFLMSWIAAIQTPENLQLPRIMATGMLLGATGTAIAVLGLLFKFIGICIRAITGED